VTRSLVTVLLLAAFPASAADVPIPRPDPPDVIEGQCLQNYALSKGKPLPAGIMAYPTAKPVGACSAVIVPLSDYADLLITEEWAQAIEVQYNLDTTMLETELDWYKKRLEEESKPDSFFSRPDTQRWIGRVETLVTVGIVAVGLGAAYQYGAGGTK
jgi:hypothetical protein